MTRRPDLAALAEKVRQLQIGRRGPLRRCPTGLTSLDAALGGGFARGCTHELLSPNGAAPARSLALWAAARASDGRITADTDMSRSQITADTAVPRLKDPAGWHGRVGREYAELDSRAHDTGHPRPAKWVFYIDAGGDFYPPAAVQLGLPLERLLVIRTKRNADALWVCEQALRCQAVAAVVLPIRTIDAYVSRRLQLAAETGGGLGFLLRSDARGGHTFAATRLRLDLLPNKDPIPCMARNGVPVSTVGQQPDPLPGTNVAADDFYANRRMRVTPLKLRDSRLTAAFELILPPPMEPAAIPCPSSSAIPPPPPPRRCSRASAS